MGPFLEATLHDRDRGPHKSHVAGVRESWGAQSTLASRPGRSGRARPGPLRGGGAGVTEAPTPAPPEGWPVPLHGAAWPSCTHIRAAPEPVDSAEQKRGEGCKSLYTRAAGGPGTLLSVGGLASGVLGPAVQHRELSPISCDNLSGKRA